MHTHIFITLSEREERVKKIGGRYKKKSREKMSTNVDEQTVVEQAVNE